MDQFRNNQSNNEGEKSKVKTVWKYIGLMCLALVIAVVTVFVLNLNR